MSFVTESEVILNESLSSLSQEFVLQNTCHRLEPSVCNFIRTARTAFRVLLIIPNSALCNVHTFNPY